MMRDDSELFFVLMIACNIKCDTGIRSLYVQDTCSIFIFCRNKWQRCQDKFTRKFPPPQLTYRVLEKILKDAETDCLPKLESCKKGAFPAKAFPAFLTTQLESRGAEKKEETSARESECSISTYLVPNHQ